MAALDPQLDVDDIQGAVLAGFSKDVQIVLGAVIDDVAGAKRWLRAVHGHVSSTSEVLAFNRLFRSVRARTRRQPMGLSSTWLSIALSRDGVAKLAGAAEADGLPDEAFRKGMPVRAAAILGDPTDAASPSHPSNWVVGAPGRVPDLLLIIAADEETAAHGLVARLRAAEGATALRIVYEETGRTRPDLPGHEHFGFKDGISQPGVRGRASADLQDFVTRRLLDPGDPLAADFAAPGQPLVMPGHFVVGYPTQSPNDGSIQAASPLAHAWYRNGSFLVFRRLRQDVAAFRAFVRTAAATLAAEPALAHLTPGLLAATIVGRWPDGTPITRSPAEPNALMSGPTAANAFAFANDMPVVTMRSGVAPDAAPPAKNDALAAVCPHWAHVRKVNPRDDQTDLGTPFDTLTRRMLRRGIPYGAPMAADALVDDGVDRGLLFLAYHASIEQSFEKITSDWANQLANPSPNGHDPIIGQSNTTATRARLVSLPTPAGPTVDLPIDVEWVRATGGGYFFAPSLSAIHRRLAV